ncbi:hypothetical protein RFI_13638 [Reticulomyxa filosa]|uniref:Uncharacterized protein n=1 Tax=Reticulomyxa filosa TaxID=46433 RepID=X6NCA9_RETFI|nr:hypothetical protein RFI_13638 [Reticulomyxa filosa]|eukprot:ETO23538.1 hypothetical protein RFI_13638 [Reticulomyxa filosa]
MDDIKERKEVAMLVEHWSRLENFFVPMDIVNLIFTFSFFCLPRRLTFNRNNHAFLDGWMYSHDDEVVKKVISGFDYVLVDLEKSMSPINVKEVTSNLSRCFRVRINNINSWAYIGLSPYKNGVKFSPTSYAQVEGFMVRYYWQNIASLGCYVNDILICKSPNEEYVVEMQVTCDVNQKHGAHEGHQRRHDTVLHTASSKWKEEPLTLHINLLTDNLSLEAFEIPVDWFGKFESTSLMWHLQ